MSNNQYTPQQIQAVRNNPNDMPPKKVAEMVEAGCFTIDQLTTLSPDQKRRVEFALLAGKEDVYFNKCMSAEGSVADCDFFIEKYPNSTRKSEVVSHKAELELIEANKAQEDRDFNELTNKVNDSAIDPEGKKTLISAFEAKYPFTRFAGRLQDLKDKVKAEEDEREANREAEDAWQALLVVLASNTSVARKRQEIDAYVSKYSIHTADIATWRKKLDDQEDEDAWQYVLSLIAQDIPTAQKMAALNSYKSRFSLHASEVDIQIEGVKNEIKITPEIQGVVSNSAATVSDFMRLIAKYPSKKDYIKSLMLSDMKINASRYTRESMYYLIMGKYDGDFTYPALFSIDELISAGAAPRDILEHIMSHPTDDDDRDGLEDTVQPETNFKSAKHNTDVYFFGVPGSGKSTVLAGLFNLGLSGNLRLKLPAHGEHIGYNYANILQGYLNKNVFPQATKTRFVIRQDLTPVDSEATNPFADPFGSMCVDTEAPADVDLVGTVVSDKFIQIIDGVIQENPGRDNQEDHKISIIEMPGERTLDFAAADIHDLDAAKKLLGEGTLELFMNDNRKVFFIVIDPKPQKTYEVRLNGDIAYLTQAQALEAVLELIGLMPDLLQKIDSMHIILTKSDLLSNPGSEEVIERDVLRKGYEGLVADIISLCSPARGNINAQCDHMPHLFTFSLGKIYPGHMIKYQKDDAEKILRVITANTYSTRRNPTKWSSFIDWMNK